MKKVVKALEEIFKKENNVHSVHKYVNDRDRVWKLLLECNHVLVVPHWGTAPKSMTCLSCVDDKPEGRDLRQEQVADWCRAAFGHEHTTNVKQRAIRLLEEAIEAYQAAGGDHGMAFQLVDYIFERPKGQLGQELGGIGVTLLALANAAGLSAEEEEVREVARVLSIDLDVMRKRNAVKNAAGFNVTDKK